MKKEKKDIKTE